MRLHAISGVPHLIASSLHLNQIQHDSSKVMSRWKAHWPGPRGTGWFPHDKAFRDYFTPPELIQAARLAMGGIDLDAASHPIANREHRIPDYFHINRNAFEHRWYGKVWLNPPYGNNAPWFDRIEQFLDSGDIEQLCILSPVWAFTTEQAKRIMRRSAAIVLLSPTPKFWGNADGKTGANHPHCVVYFGERIDDFVNAFVPFGIPIEMAWERVLELSE